MKYWTIIIASAFFFCTKVFSQCVEKNFAFEAGEEAYYDVYYNWGIVWVSAGEVYFKVHDAEYKGQPAYQLDSYGHSLKRWDWFYKVRDSYVSYVDQETLAPYYFKRNTSEGGYEVDNEYIFDYTEHHIISKTENSDKPRETDTLELSPCTFDVLSVIYYARNINYSKYQVGDKIPITCIIDGQIYNLYIRYLGKESIETRNNQTYECIKFKPLLVEGTIFSGGEDMTVWVTDDKNRLPVLVEAKVLVGAIKAYLREANGLRYDGSYN